MDCTPSREEFRALGAEHRLVPVWTTVLADSETPLSVYRKLAEGTPGSFLLESASEGKWNRYSFIGRNPLATLTEDGGEVAWIGEVPVGAPTSGDPLEAARAVLELFAIDKPDSDLPPMISSLVGYLGWDIVRRFERLGHGPLPEDRVPELSLSIPGDVAIFDHYTSRLTLVANVFNMNGEASGIDEAHASGVARLEAMITDLLAPAPATIATFTPLEPEVKPRTAKEDYLASVERAQRDIVDGEIFQVVLGQRFDSPVDAAPIDVYRMLRATNPSPYMYLLDVPTPDGRPLTVVGSSPEALVTVTDGTVLTHPIAGSRPRGEDPASDVRLGHELLADEKERAEHLMLVDLARNDLAKICTPGTVDVTEFMELERYSHIMHIVSSVTGELAPGVDGIDVLAATFPAGTLSGAPKPSALRIIDELEPVARGVYGGVVGYLSFTGDLDVAIAIRTGIMRPGTISVSAGAGIVADSVPETEYVETQNKAAAVLRAAAAAHTLRTPGADDRVSVGETR
ncbi:anthranilate synthase component I [Brevibacterium samyangense]|uniref:Anthranilate synthase component 1 n=1 Tax=Brevibacterium samyangense TaxID=366888 RepID=A0ABP5EXB4_9MICO